MSDLLGRAGQGAPLPPPPGDRNAGAPPPPSQSESLDAVRDKAERLFMDLLASLDLVRVAVKGGQALPWAPLQQVIERVIDSLEASGELFWVANRPSLPEGCDYLAFHGARVAVISVRLGAIVGSDRQRQIELGMAAALIDIGLWLLSPSLLRNFDGLSGDDLEQYRSHPRVAADLIRRAAPPYASIPDIVLQHHERELGQGYPQGLPSSGIRPDAKIVALVDTYTGLTAPASLRPGLRSHEAIRELVRSKHEAFAPALIKALLSEISVFPPGTLVRLNTGEVGCVTAVNRNHPLRPRVEVFDSKGRRLATPKLVDLSETPFIYITGAVAETER